MESLSRPPHRRKHSAAADVITNFAGKNPYDDVFLSRGGKGRALEIHEYNEIFAGAPSNIPVLDLSGLDEVADSGDGQISGVDYSNIFGGLRNDDVGAPYEELVNGSGKRAKPRTPANSKPPLRQPGSSGSSGNIRKPSEETSSQSVDGVKQQFNVSFNKSNQRESDSSNGKTHIAQLHSVSGFTYLVDETSQDQKGEDHKTVPPLKRDVSRTWSFSAEVEDVKGKRGVSSEKSRMSDVLHHKNEANAKSKVSSSSNRMLNPNNGKDPKHAKASKFTPKEDASKKTPAEHSPPFLDEEFNENSMAAASAAALKKAIEQAQESIRLAKLIMERKKAGHEDRSKATSRGHRVKDLGKETEIEDEVYGSKENISGKEYEELNAAFMGVGEKRCPPLLENDTLPNAKVETAREKVEVAKEPGEGFSWRGLLFGLSSGQTNGRTVKSGSELGGNKNVSMLSMSKLEPDLGRMETDKETLEQREIAFSCAGREVLVEMAGQGLNAPQGLQDLKKSVEEPELYQATSNHAEGPEVLVEPLGGVLDTSRRALEQEKVEEEDDNNWRAGLREEVTEKRENDVGDMQRHGKMSEERKEVDGVEHLTAQESVFDVFLNQSCKMMGSEANDASGCKENGHDDRGAYDEVENEMRWNENHISFESKEHLGKVLDEEIVLTELSVDPEIGRIGKKVQIYESEIDKKQNCSCDGEAPKVSGRVEQDVIEERHEDTVEREATESKFMEASSLAKNEPFWDVQKTESTIGETGRSGEDCIEEKCENIYEDQVDERQMVEAADFADVQKEDTFQYGEETKGTHRGTGSCEDHNDERHENASDHEADGDQATEADSFAGVQIIYWDVDGTNISFGGAERSEESHNEERPNVTSEHEVDERRVTETSSSAEVPENEPIWDVEETRSSLGGTGRSEEHHCAFEFQEAVYEERADEVVDANTGGASTIFNETRETCGIEQYPEAVTLPAETGSLNDKDVEAEQSFHPEDCAIPGTANSHRSGDEGDFVESRQKNGSESLASYSKTENLGVTEQVSKESSPEEEPTSKTECGIPGTVQYYADDSLSGDNTSENRNEEFELTDERPVVEQTSDSDEESISTHSPEDSDGLSTHESEGCADVKNVIPSKQEMTNEPKVSNERKLTEDQSEGLCSSLQNETKEMHKSMEAKRPEPKGSNIENENLNGTTMRERDSPDGVQQRIEAIKKAREREKERLVVERAIREARERAFAEARERAEKAAAERAAAGVQQRVVAEAQEKLEKASAVNQPAGKASIEAKLRAERAAVERASAEARGRALEKAMSQKTSNQTRSVVDRNNVLKHSFSSSDLESTTASESAQRRKARLERHQRIMERAAKALAEKNKRDLLAQKEQAERNRLAESLDADIKRWATGKEGNLRALLSTLQYILGRDSGWQPIPLTEMLTSAAVKKAYRKATLYVHPDKLQQRGASIRQKYICEKVFDLLKAAWNKFNSEER